MGLLIDAAELVTAFNVALLAALAFVWVRNFRKFRSKHTLGLAVFALVLLSENALTLYFYLLDPTMHDWWHYEVPTLALQAALALNVLEMLAIVFLAWVTWD